MNYKKFKDLIESKLQKAKDKKICEAAVSKDFLQKLKTEIEQYFKKPVVSITKNSVEGYNFIFESAEVNISNDIKVKCTPGCYYSKEQDNALYTYVDVFTNGRKSEDASSDGKFVYDIDPVTAKIIKKQKFNF